MQVDASAVVKCAVAFDLRVLDRQRGVLRIQPEAAAVVGGHVLLDQAVFDRGISFGLQTDVEPAAVVADSVVGDGDVLEAQATAVRAVDAAAVVLRAVQGHEATRHVQGTVVQDAAAVAVRSIGGDGAALEIDGRALVDVDAATLVRVAAGDDAGVLTQGLFRGLAVLYGEHRALVHLDDVAALLLGPAVAVQRVAVQVDGDFTVVLPFEILNLELDVVRAGPVVLLKRHEVVCFVFGIRFRRVVDERLEVRPVGFEPGFRLHLILVLVPQDGNRARALAEVPVGGVLGDLLAGLVRGGVVLAVVLREHANAVHVDHADVGAGDCAGQGQLLAFAQIEVWAAGRLVVANDDLSADLGLVRIRADLDAAASAGSLVALPVRAADDRGLFLAPLEHELLVGVDGAAVITSLVAVERAAVHRERPRAGSVVVVEDGAAMFAGAVIADCAVRERRRAVVLDTAAFLAFRIVTADGDVGRREGRLARDLDAAGVVLRYVLRERAFVHGDRTPVEEDTRAVVLALVLLDARVGNRQLLVFCVHVKAAAVVSRPVIADLAVLDGRVCAHPQL